MKPVFLDTVGILALLDEDDQWHSAAAQAYTLIQASRRRIVTTLFVLLECGNAAARRPYRKDVDDLRQSLADNDGLLDISSEDLLTAWAEYRRGNANEAGIVDQVSFAVMRRIGLTDVFSNDRHFAAAGFHLLF
jgi:uncharacterized protein